MSDSINHPAHYNTGTIEVIEFIEDKQLDFHLGNAVKYICRAGKKDPDKEIEDLKKAVWYLNRKIEQGKMGLNNEKGRVDDPPLPEYTIEVDSCYRGKIETHRSIRTGEIIYQNIER